MKEMAGAIAELLKQNRAYKGMTQQQLSQESGVNVKKISQVEIGRRKLTVDELFAIDEVFDCDIIWDLMNRRDNDTSIG